MQVNKIQKQEKFEAAQETIQLQKNKSEYDFNHRKDLCDTRHKTIYL